MTLYELYSDILDRLLVTYAVLVKLYDRNGEILSGIDTDTAYKYFLESTNNIVSVEHATVNKYTIDMTSGLTVKCDIILDIDKNDINDSTGIAVYC